MNDTSAGARFTKHELVIAAVNLFYIVLASIAAWVSGNQEFVFYLVVMCLLMAIAGYVHFQIKLSVAALWGLTVWGAAHMAGGLVVVPGQWPTAGESRVLYNWWLIPNWLKFDQVVHAFGFGLMTWICWQGLQYSFRKSGAELRPSWGVLVLCVAGGMGFGAANEVVEFAATQLLPETNVGGYVNTGWDLVANLVGSVIAAVLIHWLAKPREV